MQDINDGKTGRCSFPLVYSCVLALLIQQALAAVPGQERLATFSLDERIGVSR